MRVVTGRQPMGNSAGRRLRTRSAAGHRFVSTLVVAAAVLVSCALVAEAQPTEWPCGVRTTDRIVAVGDIHGAYESFVQLLRAAALIDRRDRWIGGRAVLVQTGDVLDRGPDSRKAIDLLRRLERDASRAGGRVIALLGNHEVMRLIGDWRYVSEGEYRAFERSDSAALRQRALDVVAAEALERARSERRSFDEGAFREEFVKRTPLGSLEMRFAFENTGDYGRWVRQRPTLAKVNGLLFLHGGLTAEVAALGCPGINDAIHKELMSLPVPPERLSALMATSETGPLWYRGLAVEPEGSVAPEVDATLRHLDARGLVIGHTTVLPGRVATRLGGKVLQIDAGMVAGQFYPGGVPVALEIRGDTLTAISLEGRVPVAAPALEPAGTGAR